MNNDQLAEAVAEFHENEEIDPLDRHWVPEKFESVRRIVQGESPEELYGNDNESEFRRDVKELAKTANRLSDRYLPLLTAASRRITSNKVIGRNLLTPFGEDTPYGPVYDVKENVPNPMFEEITAGRDFREALEEAGINEDEWLHFVKFADTLDTLSDAVQDLNEHVWTPIEDEKDEKEIEVVASAPSRHDLPPLLIEESEATIPESEIPTPSPRAIEQHYAQQAIAEFGHPELLYNPFSLQG